MNSDDKNKTQMDFRAITRDMVDRGVIDEDAAYRLEKGYERNSTAGKLLVNIKEYWIRYLIGALLTLGGGIFTFRDTIESFLK